jgi:hypothetical protein
MNIAGNNKSFRFSIQFGKLTVVSSVFEKQFSKSQASSGSEISFFTLKMVSSTAMLLKFLLEISGRKLV